MNAPGQPPCDVIIHDVIGWQHDLSQCTLRLHSNNPSSISTMQQTSAHGSRAATRGAARQPSSVRCLGPRLGGGSIAAPLQLTLLAQQQQRGSVVMRYREGERDSSSSSKPKGGSPYTPGYAKQPGGSSSSGYGGYGGNSGAGDGGYQYGIPVDWADGLQDSWRDLQRRFDSWPPQQRNATLGYTAGAGLALYLANGLLNSLHGLPLLPEALQLIGLAFSTWFFARYLLFAEGRRDLAADFTLEKLTGQAAQRAATAGQRAEDSAGAALGDVRQRLDGGAAASRPSGSGSSRGPLGGGTASRGADGGSRLSDGRAAAYSQGQLESDITSALQDLDGMAE